MIRTYNPLTKRYEAPTVPKDFPSMQEQLLQLQRRIEALEVMFSNK